jgi:hypothetical protein
MKPQASTWIMTNNISVGFMTFAGGILGGPGTVYLLSYNGLQLGVVGTACARQHMALDLWSFVASHGALELPSIVIAGAAGLRLAMGMLFPGIYTRRDSLARAAVEAIRLVAGTVPLLVIAGTLEAFLSPSGAPMAVKFLTGAVLLLGLGLWLTSQSSELRAQSLLSPQGSERRAQPRKPRSGAKAPFLFAGFTARLKSCPVTKAEFFCVVAVVTFTGARFFRERCDRVLLKEREARG